MKVTHTTEKKEVVIFAVIGEGPNGLEIPLVIFPTKEEADKFVDTFPKNKKYPGVLDDDFVLFDGIYRDEDGDDEMDQSEIGRPLYHSLFKDGNYYPGCGGLSCLLVREVTFGSPIVGWDLD